MTWTTDPPTEIPYAEDGDPRALWPATSQAVAERLHELLANYSTSSLVYGQPTPGTGAANDIEWPGLAGTPEFVLAGGGAAIDYTGPDRWFLVTLQVTMGAGEALRSRVGIGTAVSTGVYDRESHMCTGTGLDTQATHTHSLSLHTLLGPSGVTRLVFGVFANVASLSDVAFDARFDVVSL